MKLPTPTTLVVVALCLCAVNGCADAGGNMSAESSSKAAAENPSSPSADTTATPVADSTSRQHTPGPEVQAFLGQHCLHCHGVDEQEGSFRLDTLETNFADPLVAARWVEVSDRVILDEMPPPDEPRPKAAAQQQLVTWVRDQLRHAQASKSRTLPPLVRRLSRTEYANTVRDLLQVEFLPGEGPLDLLPPDGSVGGFDKLSESLRLDPSLLEAYLATATQIAERAVLTGDVSRPPIPTERHRFEYENTPIHPYEITTRPWTIVRPDGLIIFSGAAGSKDGLRHSHGGMVPVAGKYTVRVRAAANSGKSTKPFLMKIWRGGTGETLLQRQVDAPLDRPQVYETTIALEPEGNDGLNIILEGGTHFAIASETTHHLNREAEKALAAGNPRQAGALRAQARAEGAVWWNRPNPATLKTDDLPRLFLDYIEIEGPLYDQWPPASHRAVFPVRPAGESDAAYLRRIFARLLPRAYRRAVSSDEIDTIVGVATQEQAAGASLQESIRAALVAVLCSPSFLHVFETGPAGDDGDHLGDDQIAARLSYFLWSSLPDDDLLGDARQGKLRDPAVRRAQLRRMLADPRSDALVSDFAAQWLRTDELNRFAADRQLYPVLYEPQYAGLEDEFRQEPLEFFRHVLRNDLSVASFLDSDWTMVNDRLARYYGLAAVEGREFRRVELPADSPRGGLLGMAGVHRWGSDGNRTRPVHRGAYVLEVLFNDPPDPPPPGAGEVEPNVDGENLSVRDRLAAHRQLPACAGCHGKIDPYGLALENFNAIGLWRERQDGEVRNWNARGGPRSIDPSGTLPNGQDFQTYAEFRKALLAQSDRFRRALAEKLLSYALGRRLVAGDRLAVDASVAHMKRHGDSIGSLLEAIVGSEAFTLR